MKWGILWDVLMQFAICFADDGKAMCKRESRKIAHVQSGYGCLLSPFLCDADRAF